MGRRCSECDAVLLADVWTQFSKGAVHKCLNCKRKGGFRKAINLSRERREEASHARKMRKRTITVLFMCELCEMKGRSLKYCVRHGHDERRVYSQQDDPDELGDEVMNHDVFQQHYPDVKLDHGHDAPILRRPSQEEETQEAIAAGVNNRSHHGADEALTVQMQPPSYDSAGNGENRGEREGKTK